MAPKYQGRSRICISISKIPGIQYSVLAAAKTIVFFTSKQFREGLVIW